jgi:uncharacterized protein (DUF433 family)
MNQYIDPIADGFRIAGTRVSLDSIVYAFRDGLSAESIAENFPTLSLEQVYGAIAFYLANREAVDATLEAGKAEFETIRQNGRDSRPELFRRLDALRRRDAA